MELEQVKSFALRKDALEEDIKSYAPSETGYERLTPQARFDGLWTRFDDLAAEDPTYDGLKRDRFKIRDTDGISLSITRSQRQTEGRMDDIRIRTITAQWSTMAGELATESLDDELIRDNHADWVINGLGLLEETEAAVRTMIEEHSELMEYVRLHPISEGHP
jgi:hypothetical protein